MLVVLDLVAIAALVVAILPEEPFPPPLLVGYALTALGGVTAVLFIVYDHRQAGERGAMIVDAAACECTERISKTLL